ncbi:hypothetical protein [Novispirillum itersonii]|uniref:DUF1236 domain-containing protein n=1 Tax=Novispirillum itersonii TaxID=189 RepID=A0A7W9ZHZ1_NOVIT|nr:hypothetical protein [Novispirillum itersonii]MBB6211823.1 hypothetical protein [Novispirillum itersonii]
MSSLARFSLRAMLLAAVGLTTLSAPAFADPPWKQDRGRDWSDHDRGRHGRGWDDRRDVRRGPPAYGPRPYVVLERERYVYIEPPPRRVYVMPPPRPDVTVVIPLNF